MATQGAVDRYVRGITLEGWFISHLSTVIRLNQKAGLELLTKGGLFDSLRSEVASCT